MNRVLIQVIRASEERKYGVPTDDCHLNRTVYAVNDYPEVEQGRASRYMLLQQAILYKYRISRQTQLSMRRVCYIQIRTYLSTLRSSWDEGSRVLSGSLEQDDGR